jgi:hypothetical protein
MADLRRAAIDRGIVASIGETTIWRWLSEDANQALEPIRLEPA